MKYKNGKCVLVIDPTCAPGTKLDQNTKECASVTGPERPSGQPFKNGRCALDLGDCLDLEFCPVGPSPLQALDAI